VFDKLQYPAEVLPLGPFHNRKEERMNFAVAVKVDVDDKITVLATTSDLSVNGCKIRLTERQNIKIGRKINLQFIGLEQEFQFGQYNAFEYQIRNMQVIDSVQLVGLERIYSVGQEKDGFRQFLKGFVQGKSILIIQFLQLNRGVINNMFCLRSTSYLYLSNLLRVNIVLRMH